MEQYYDSKGIEVNAFTGTATGLLNRLTSDAHIGANILERDVANVDPSTWPLFTALWDTGAQSSGITLEVVEACNLVSVGEGMVTGATGEATPTLIYHITICLKSGGMCISNIYASLLDLKANPDIRMLIGMDVITRGDFAITNKNRQTQWTFRIPSEKHLDFVSDYQKKQKRKYRR